MILGEQELRLKFSNCDNEQFQPNGIDLRVKSVETFENNHNEIIGIYDGEKHFPSMKTVKPTNKKYLLKKGTPYLFNLGDITIPTGTIGLFYIRSTFMRMGCQLSSSVADMDYSGSLKMMYYNPIKDVCINHNERVVQMVIYEAQNSGSYDGTYQENKWVIDDEILIAIGDDKLPITIFGKTRKLSGYLVVDDKRLHRLIYEYYNGEIPEGYVVHHINHNKLDNRIGNLELMEDKVHRSHHNKGICNPSTKNKKYDLPYGFTKNEDLSNGYGLCFKYFDDNNIRKKITRTRIDELVKESISILSNLKKDYSGEIEDIKEWSNTHDIDVLSFKKLERNNLPKGCTYHKRQNRKGSYEFYHPNTKFLGSSVDFETALIKAIDKTDDELYKSYLIKRWLNKSLEEK